MQTRKISDYPRILIVGTLPYNPNESSRALDTYFRNWPRENLRMLFSNKQEPIKGHCSSLLQIYDMDLLKSKFKKGYRFEKIYNYDDLLESDVNNKKAFTALEKRAKRKTAFRFLMRKKIWSKDRWYSTVVKDWVNDFNPEAIYICFSDDYFILDIGYKLATERNIPIICQISDDYYFLFKRNKSLLLKGYTKKYLELFDKIMSTAGFAFYISDKIADKYNSTFKKQGFPIYLSSDICATDNSSKKINLSFNYLGKVNLGRYQSLSILNQSLMAIDPTFKINVYTQNTEGKFIKPLIKSGCNIKTPVGYDEVQRIITSGGFNIIASGFEENDVEKSKYSLSTKVADCLASGSPIIAIGSGEDGAIEYLKKNKCAFVIDSKKPNLEELKEFIFNEDAIKEKVKTAQRTYESNHLFEKNNELFFDACCKMIKKR